MFVGQIQLWLVFAISIGAVALEGYALVQALRYSNGQYVAAGKWTKQVWTGILGAATAIGFLGIQPPIGFGLLYPIGLLPFAAMIGAGVFLASVLPALRGTGRPGGGKSGGQSRGGW